VGFKDRLDASGKIANSRDPKDAEGGKVRV